MILSSNFRFPYDQSPEQSENTAALIFQLLIFSAPVIYWIIKFIYKRRLDHLWASGFFPKQLAFKREHLMEAYICLAARMIQSDTEDAGEKVRYMNNYFQRYFPKVNYNFSESISYSYRHPIKIGTVAHWLNLHIHNREQRMQVMYFLAGLAIVDGRLLKAEIKILRLLNDFLELSPKDFDSIIAMYQQQQERQKNHHKQNTVSTISNKERLILLSSKVLGISEFASMDEVKKAYRSLVKIHHPDKFANESTDQQRIAEERFIEIQKAYENLEKWK